MGNGSHAVSGGSTVRICSATVRVLLMGLQRCSRLFGAPLLLCTECFVVQAKQDCGAVRCIALGEVPSIGSTAIASSAAVALYASAGFPVRTAL